MCLHAIPTTSMYPIINNKFESTFEYFRANKIQQNDFTIIQLNIQSCANLNVFDELKLFISECKSKIDIIILCETWFNPNMCDLYSIDGYNSFHSCRELRSGGGFSIYVLNTLSVRNLEKRNDDLTYIKLNISSIESLNEINVIGFYRVPKYNNLNRFFDLIDCLLHTNGNKKCILAGDINIDIHPNKSNAIKTSYINILSSHNFTVCNTSSTRDISGTIVDHIATNINSDFQIKIDTICVPFSDHNMLKMSFDCSQAPKSSIKSYKRINFAMLNENLQKVCNERPIVSNCVNELYDYISQNIQNELNKATETKTIKMSKMKECEWMLSYPNIQFIMKKKINLIKKRKQKKRSNRSCCLIDKKIDELDNKIKSIVSSAKSQYYSRLFTNSSTKDTWKKII